MPLIISIPGLTFRQEEQNDFVQNCDSEKTVENPVELLDLFPTIAELAGVSISKCPKNEEGVKPPDLCGEGMSLVPLIEGALKNTVRLL